ncbi:translationally-controlled tumor protein [Xylariaceae sp. FL0804]|nr:translationally-controlled tumor protein [Xylariaceae sp. FL0804]
MIIFKDAIGPSNDELISDSFNLKEVDNIAYEADCAMIQIDAVNVDTGANASAEEADEGTEDSAQKVNNIIHSFRLQPTQFDKNTYVTVTKDYLKKVAAHLKKKNLPADELKAWQTGALGLLNKVKKNFDDYEFYTGENMDVDGMVVLLNYREDGITPYVTLWKHGLDEMKV